MRVYVFGCAGWCWGGWFARAEVERAGMARGSLGKALTKGKRFAWPSAAVGADEGHGRCVHGDAEGGDLAEHGTAGAQICALG